MGDSRRVARDFSQQLVGNLNETGLISMPISYRTPPEKASNCVSVVGVGDKCELVVLLACTPFSDMLSLKCFINALQRIATYYKVFCWLGWVSGILLPTSQWQRHSEGTSPPFFVLELKV